MQQISVLNGSKAQNALRNKITILKARGKKVVELLYSRQELYRIGEEVIHSGKFPWQPLQQSGKTFIDGKHYLNIIVGYFSIVCLYSTVLSTISVGRQLDALILTAAKRKSFRSKTK